MNMKHIFLSIALLGALHTLNAQQLPSVIVSFNQGAMTDTTVSYDLQFGGFVEMVSFQFSIAWAASDLTLTNVEQTSALEDFDENSLGLGDPGVLRALWIANNLIPVSLDPDTVVMTLTYRINNSDYADPIFTDCPIPIEFVSSPTFVVGVVGDVVYSCTQIVASVSGQLSGDCTPGNIGLQGIGLSFESLSGGGSYQTTSLSGGLVLLQIAPGDYIVTLTTPASSLWEPCLNDIPITIDTSTTSFEFTFSPTASCPQTVVEISSPFLRRCFPSTYYVSYGNQGTVDAEDAMVTVALDSNLTYLSGSVAPTQIDAVTNTLTYSVGDLAPGDFGAIQLQVEVSCETILGQMLCSSAEITPDTICGAVINWSGASLEANAVCTGDSVALTVQNIGTAPMPGPMPVMVIEDDVIVFYEEISLPVGATYDKHIFAGGNTYRIQAAQPANHPFGNQAFAVVEGCTAEGVSGFSTGFGTLFNTNPGALTTSVHCGEVIGAYDPNDKLVEPRGVGSDGKVEPGTPMTYTIRFQNTGTDTAFRVFLIDTIQEGLDIRTLEVLGASHSHEVQWIAPRVMQIDFQDIRLVDSFANEAASHGFFRYRLQQSESLPLLSVLENYADIYFDFNTPVRTNTTRNVIDLDFLDVLSGTTPVPANSDEVLIVPHPVTSTSQLIVKDATSPLTLSLYDATGRAIRQVQSTTGVFEISSENNQNGVYYYVVKGEGINYSGKLILINN